LPGIPFVYSFSPVADFIILSHGKALTENPENKKVRGRRFAFLQRKGKK